MRCRPSMYKLYVLIVWEYEVIWGHIDILVVAVRRLPREQRGERSESPSPSPMGRGAEITNHRGNRCRCLGVDTFPSYR
jgi:hypothetical protein